VTHRERGCGSKSSFVLVRRCAGHWFTERKATPIHLHFNAEFAPVSRLRKVHELGLKGERRSSSQIRTGRVGPARSPRRGPRQIRTWRFPPFGLSADTVIFSAKFKV
jgi:hypothetical protein